MSKRGVVEPFLVGALVEIGSVIVPVLWNDGINQRRELLREPFATPAAGLLVREKRLQVGNYVPMAGAEVGRVVRTGLVKVWEVQLLREQQLENGVIIAGGEVVNILAGSCRHLQHHYRVDVASRRGLQSVYGKTVREVLDKARAASSDCDATDKDFKVERLVPPRAILASYAFAVPLR